MSMMKVLCLKNMAATKDHVNAFLKSASLMQMWLP